MATCLRFGGCCRDGAVHRTAPVSLCSATQQKSSTGFTSTHAQDAPIRLRVDLDTVARTGDLAFMQWIEEHRRDLAHATWSPKVLGIASDRGDLTMVQWLLEHRMKNDPFAEIYMSTGLSQGWRPFHQNRAVVSYKVTKFVMPELHSGHLQLIRWLNSDYQWKDASSRSLWIQKVALYVAALGDVELIQVLEEGDMVFSSVEDCFQAHLWLAAYHGNMAMVQWLYGRGGRLDGRIMDAAAAGGHVQILQWLLETGDDRIRHNEAMYAAVCAEQRNAIDWLLENRTAGRPLREPWTWLPQEAT